MYLFEWFTKLTHPARKIGWTETTAYFTGVSRTAKRAKGTHYPQMTVTGSTEATEYEIRYYTDDQQRTGWYLFCPGPNPDPEDIRGIEIRIRYKRSRPWIFERIPDPENGK